MGLRLGNVTVMFTIADMLAVQMCNFIFIFIFVFIYYIVVYFRSSFFAIQF